MTKPLTKTIEFEGNTFEYNPNAITSYKVLKAIARASDDIAGFFTAFETIFVGKDEEYAELLNNDFEKLGELVSKVVEETNEAKN